MVNRARFFSLDFWIIVFMLVTCIVFLIFCEIIPSDLFIRERQYKSNPKYTYKKELKRMMLCSKAFYTDSLEKYYQNPDLLFEDATYLLKSKFKNKNKAIIIVDNVHLVVHCFNKKSLWRALFSLPFKASDAYRAWHNGQTLMKHKINCTKPLLVIEKRLGPYCTSSYLVTNYITGSSSVHFFKKNSAFKEKWADAADNIQEMLSQLEASKLRHLKFSLKNFILKDEKPYLIDLDRLRKFKFKTFLSKKNILNAYLSGLEKELLNSKSQAHPIFHERSLKLSP